MFTRHLKLCIKQLIHFSNSNLAFYFNTYVQSGKSIDQYFRCFKKKLSSQMKDLVILYSKGVFKKFKFPFLRKNSGFKEIFISVIYNIFNNNYFLHF